MSAVLRLARYAHEGNNDEVGDKVAERVYAIGYHCRAASNDASQQFEEAEQYVCHGSIYRDAVDFAFALVVLCALCTRARIVGINHNVLNSNVIE